MLTPADQRQHTNVVWGTTCDTKPTQRESGFTLSFQRGNGSKEEQLFASSNHSLSAYQTSGGFSAGKNKFQLGILHFSLVFLIYIDI